LGACYTTEGKNAKHKRVTFMLSVTSEGYVTERLDFGNVLDPDPTSVDYSLPCDHLINLLFS